MTKAISLINLISNENGQGFLSSVKELSAPVRDKQLVRAAMKEELRIITYYEQTSKLTDNSDLIKLFEEMVHDKKVHFEQLEIFLEETDAESDDIKEEAEEELDEILGVEIL